MPGYKSDKGKIFFIHIPRTGGLALQIALEKSFKRDGQNTGDFKSPCSNQHKHYSLLDEEESLEDQDYIFTVIRDPIERLQSCYKWTLDNANEWISTYKDQFGGMDKYINSLVEEMTFQEFVIQSFKDYEENNFVQDNHIRAQSHYIGPKVDKIYRYPDVFKELPIDLKKIGFSMVSNIPVCNSSSIRELNIDKETMDLIQKLYKDDPWYDK